MGECTRICVYVGVSVFVCVLRAWICVCAYVSVCGCVCVCMCVHTLEGADLNTGFFSIPPEVTVSERKSAI